MSLGHSRPTSRLSAAHQKIIILKESANDAQMFQHSLTSSSGSSQPAVQQTSQRAFQPAQRTKNVIIIKKKIIARHIHSHRTVPSLPQAFHVDIQVQVQVHVQIQRSRSSSSGASPMQAALKIALWKCNAHCASRKSTLSEGRERERAREGGKWRDEQSPMAARSN